jgi:hypothetical protein
MQQNQSGWLGLERNSDKTIPVKRKRTLTENNRFSEEKDDNDPDVFEIPKVRHDKAGKPDYRNQTNNKKGYHLEHQNSPTKGYSRIDPNADIF